MKVLSLFDGISCARVALDKLGYKNVEYYASEIDKYAIQISQKNWPDIIELGDIKNITRDLRLIMTDYSKKCLPDGLFDLLIGGSPCQDLSIAKRDRKGLDGERSGLFWEYVRILREIKPKYFILENVASMPKEAKDIITKTLGVEPIMINASLVSAQNRKRLFWTNISNVALPEDRGILLKDILEDDADTEKLKSFAITASFQRQTYQGDYLKKHKGQFVNRIGQFNKGGQGDRVYSTNGKSTALSANGGGRGAKTGLYSIKDYVRKLTPIECERLQGLPDNYTEGVSNTQRYKCLGNAFNADVVVHILSFIK